ncbi:ribonuclease HII [Halococcoides cellulosivorans]|uniref:Ribonuclease HII n=1 Tax=Halococcoides cellulosivorans TaxID=1679096 RepID=A0A2R4WYH4_9EURY|nr:ribonuclease HII [Halococcoides cellulosivorans]AWB26607.1 ribonuclease HII [Halococcoides cellulosivorans]
MSARVGVDEAGKGPVLGSMFAAAVRGTPDGMPAGVDDSKALDHQRRLELAPAIRERASRVAVVEVPVAKIDGDTDMNTLTVDAHADAVASVASADDRVVHDAADTNAVRFERRVADRLATDCEVRAHHGADADDPLVAAASILAKVRREAHVERLHEEYGDCGSGYPSDPTTRAFLESYVETNEELPACARASWQTSRDVLAAIEQVDLGQF